MSIYRIASHLVEEPLDENPENPSGSFLPGDHFHNVDDRTLFRPDLVDLFSDITLENNTFRANWQPGSNDDGTFIFDDYYNDTLEFQHFGTLRRLKTLGKTKIAAGHDFEVTQLSGATFCDKCGDYIFGLYKQAVKCSSKHFIQLSSSPKTALMVKSAIILVITRVNRWLRWIVDRSRIRTLRSMILSL